MNSIKHDVIFLVLFIVVVLVAFLLPSPINQQEEDSVQLDVDEGINYYVNETFDENETLIKEELSITIT